MREPAVFSKTCEACGREWFAVAAHYVCPWCNHDERIGRNGGVPHTKSYSGYWSREDAMRAVGRLPRKPR